MILYSACLSSAAPRPHRSASRPPGPRPSSVAVPSNVVVRPGVRRVTSLPCSDFFGITYSDMGAKSSSALRPDPPPMDEPEGERVPRRRDAERERERASSPPGPPAPLRADEVIRFSGTWCSTVGPSFGSNVA